VQQHVTAGHLDMEGLIEIRRRIRVERDDEFEPALRAALVADRPTVIQLALDRAWVSIDQLPA